MDSLDALPTRSSPPPFPGWSVASYRWINCLPYRCVYVPLSRSRAHERRCCLCKHSYHPASVFGAYYCCNTKHTHYKCYSCYGLDIARSYIRAQLSAMCAYQPAQLDMRRVDANGSDPAMMAFPVRCKHCTEFFSLDDYSKHSCWGLEMGIFCGRCSVFHHPASKIHRVLGGTVVHPCHCFPHRWCPFEEGDIIEKFRWMTGNPDWMPH